MRLGRGIRMTVALAMGREAVEMRGADSACEHNYRRLAGGMTGAEEAQ